MRDGEEWVWRSIEVCLSIDLCMHEAVMVENFICLVLRNTIFCLKLARINLYLPFLFLIY